MPSTRSASFAIDSLAASSRVLSPESIGTAAAPFWTEAHRSRTTSGAPFMKATCRPSGNAWIVVMRLRSELNGNSSMRGALLRAWAASIPPLAATTTRAPSVGPR